MVWSTGGIGSIAIRAIHERPNLDLVGVWVHSPEKDGMDAGELANGEPIGLAVTTDADALIALKPDCVIYGASGPERDAGHIPDYVKLLSAGINVVTTSTTRLVNPHAYEPAEWRDQLAAAAKQGQVTLYASGIEPGFAADYLPLVLTTQSSQIEKIHCYEIGMYDDYGVPDIMSDALGFGRPLDYQPWISFPGAIAGEWHGQIRMVAEALGVELQEVRETFDRAVTERTLEVAMGTVEAGTCGALRMQAIGIVDGREAIVIEHVTRLAPDIAPALADAAQCPGISRRGHRHTGYRLHVRRDTAGPQEGRHRIDDVRRRRDGGHRDACGQRGALRGCRGTGPGEFGGAAADHSQAGVQSGVGRPRKQFRRIRTQLVDHLGGGSDGGQRPDALAGVDRRLRVILGRDGLRQLRGGAGIDAQRILVAVPPIAEAVAQHAFW